MIVKIFCHIPRENWIVDRIGSDFQKKSRNIVSFVDLNCDVIWLAAPWCWRQIPPAVLHSKLVACTIHHEVPEKFDENRRSEFLLRDSFVDVYHVPSDHTKNFIQKHTNKPIKKIGYWYDPELWKPMDRTACKEKLGINNGKFIVGSFQRDTEGSDLISPKLEKGPDRFCDYVIKMKNNGLDVHVLLGSWRRQYVINRLSQAGIGYTYNEMPELSTISEMYSACDLYFVGSRYEGGPQSLLEATSKNVPIVSTDVGMARDILPSSCIVDMDKDFQIIIPSEEDIKIANNNVQNFNMNNHIYKYDNLFEELVI